MQSSDEIGLTRSMEMDDQIAQLYNLAYKHYKEAAGNGSLIEFLQLKLVVVLEWFKDFKLLNVPLIFLGLFFCFAGQKYSRTSTFISNALIASFLAFAFLSIWIEVGPALWICTLVSALIGGILGFYIQMASTICSGILLGLICNLHLIKLIKLLFGEISMSAWVSYFQLAIVFSVAFVAIYLAFKIQPIVLVFATSWIGAFMIALGLDFAFNFTFDSSYSKYVNDVVNAVKSSRGTVTMLKAIASTKMDIMVVAIFALAVLGAVVQFLNMRKSRKN